MKFLNFSFKREAYMISILQYTPPILGILVFLILWLLGYV